MASKVDKGKGVAFAKRAKISKAQQSMLIAIGLASVVLGVTLVGVIYLVKVIRFNMDIISEKDESIKGFSRVQTNLKTIASKVGDLAVSESLEVMARNRDGENCKNFKEDGFEYSLSNISMARTCSGLRVIPDSLPSSLNQEATVSSLNWLMNKSGVGIEAISFDAYSDYNVNGNSSNNTASNDSSASEQASATTITAKVAQVNISVEDTSQKVKKMLDDIENSIRNYDVYTITIEWADSDLNSSITLNGAYVAYFSEPQTVQIKSKVICADKGSAKCSAQHGSEVSK